MADYLQPLRDERERRRLAVTVRLVRIHATPDEVLGLQRLVILVETGQMSPTVARGIAGQVQTQQQARLAGR